MKARLAALLNDVSAMMGMSQGVYVQTDSKLATLECNFPEVFTTEVQSYFSIQDKAVLAGTCRQFHSLFKSELLLLKLLTSVIRGEQEEAESIISAHPYLLYKREAVTDYSGRRVRGTPLQIALGALDVGIQAGEMCMAEMICKHLNRLPNGKALIAQQIEQQFPQGWEIERDARVLRDADALSVITRAIASGVNADMGWQEEFKQFHAYLARENKEKVFKVGHHFNIQLLIDALHFYHENYVAFGGRGGHQNRTMWGRVVGAIQCYVPANVAQAICTGVYPIVYENATLERTLLLQLGGPQAFFPILNTFEHAMGDNFAVELFDRCADWGGSGSHYSDRELPAPTLIRLCALKEAALQQIFRAYDGASLTQSSVPTALKR